MQPTALDEGASGDATGPGSKGALGVGRGQLTQEDDRHVLGKVLGLLEVRHEGADVTGKPGLAAVQKRVNSSWFSIPLGCSPYLCRELPYSTPNNRECKAD